MEAVGLIKIQLRDLGIQPTNRILLAISGGADSMCMLHVFQHHLNYAFGVAHCNFTLRGQESDLDEALVGDYCLKNNLPFYQNRFDTAQYAEENGIGIQEAARQLRYRWFETCCNQYQYDYVATAHHADDQAETILLNILRGTGIHGLTGIPAKRSFIIRPMLRTSREQILEYNQSQGVIFREDQSNQKDYYSRNFLRIHIFPLLHQINSSATEHFTQLASSALFAEKLIQSTIREFIEYNCVKHENGMTIPNQALMGTTSPLLFLFYLIQPYGFSYDQSELILDHIYQGTGGKYFFAGDQTILTQRTSIIVNPVQTEMFSQDINKLPFSVQKNRKNLHFCIKDYTPELMHPIHDQTLYLNADNIDMLALSIRSWKPADSFIPFGMKGHKKLSDYFIDKKLSIPEKSGAIILIHKDEIAAVIPYQINEKYRILDSVKKVLVISWE